MNTNFCQNIYGGLYDFGLWREICKPVLKLDFRAHGIMESLSEYRLWSAIFRGRDTPFFAPKKDFGDGFGWSKFHKWASAYQSGTRALWYRTGSGSSIFLIPYQTERMPDRSSNPALNGRLNNDMVRSSEMTGIELRMVEERFH
jgi:hypothetical protein